jgi:hypothetical protein
MKQNKLKMISNFCAKLKEIKKEEPAKENKEALSSAINSTKEG